MRRRRFLTILAACALPGAGRAETVTRRREALGAETSITLSGPAGIVRPALAEAEAIVDRVEALFSLHRPLSQISRLNRDGVLEDPPAEFLRLMRLCGRLHAATGGRFDPTVQPLWRALAEGRAPGTAHRLVGFDRVSVAPDCIRLGPGQQITLNGIAQGFATDLVADALARRGLVHALVDIGEHRALGGPFRLEIEDPAFGRLARMSLESRACATSSPGAMRLAGGADHILDPRGPGRAVWSTVTVETESAALADGLSTALCLAQRAEIGAIADRIGTPLRLRAVTRGGDFLTL